MAEVYPGCVGKQGAPTQEGRIAFAALRPGLLLPNPETPVTPSPGLRTSGLPTPRSPGYSPAGQACSVLLSLDRPPNPCSNTPSS